MLARFDVNDDGCYYTDTTRLWRETVYIKLQLEYTRFTHWYRPFYNTLVMDWYGINEQVHTMTVREI